MNCAILLWTKSTSTMLDWRRENFKFKWLPVPTYPNFYFGNGVYDCLPSMHPSIYPPRRYIKRRFKKGQQCNRCSFARLIYFTMAMATAKRTQPIEVIMESTHGSRLLREQRIGFCFCRFPSHLNPFAHKHIDDANKCCRFTIIISGRIEFYHFISIVNTNVKLCACPCVRVCARVPYTARHFEHLCVACLWKCFHSFDLFCSLRVCAMCVCCRHHHHRLAVYALFANVIRNSKCVCALESSYSIFILLLLFHIILFICARIDKVNKNQPSIRAFPHNSPHSCCRVHEVRATSDVSRGTSKRTNHRMMYLFISIILRILCLDACVCVCVRAVSVHRIVISIISRYVETAGPFSYGTIVQLAQHNAMINRWQTEMADYR